mmetsp:Transcript_17736/g.56725  ORF Transcript_17736/g.56725 Transcript_17736/m.56725 type:complete len:238 (-) Transcript_17736:620-1333(-)
MVRLPWALTSRAWLSALRSCAHRCAEPLRTSTGRSVARKRRRNSAGVSLATSTTATSHSARLSGCSPFPHPPCPPLSSSTALPPRSASPPPPPRLTAGSPSSRLASPATTPHSSPLRRSSSYPWAWPCAAASCSGVRPAGALVERSCRRHSRAGSASAASRRSEGSPRWASRWATVYPPRTSVASAPASKSFCTARCTCAQWATSRTSAARSSSPPPSAAARSSALASLSPPQLRSS